MRRDLRVRMVVLTLLLFAFVSTQLFAQTAGTILGVIKDTSGGVVPNAKVSITSVETGEVRTATTGDDGAYRFPGTRPGHYNLRVEASGYQTQMQNALTLDVAQDVVANATLQVGSATQEVTVSAEAPLVNTTSSSLGGLVNDQQIAELPLNGRNYSDLALLQPGITQTTHSGLGDAGIWFSSNGANPRSNNYTIDGALMNTQNGTGPAGMTGNTLGVDGIKEYKVLTNNFSAEYGLLMGSQVVIVSKSGTNQWHGDAFEYLRNNHLDARNYFDPPSNLLDGQRLPQFKRNNFGGAIGGPIKKDKTFFFFVYEGLRLAQGDTIQDTTMPSACHFWNTPSGPVIAGGGAISPLVNLPAGFSAASQKILKGPVGAATLATAGCGTAPAGTPVAAMVQPWIGQFPFQNEPGSTTNFFFPGATDARDDYGQLRVDHNFSVNDSFFARYTIDDGRITTPYAGGNLSSTDTGPGWPQFGNLGTSRNQYVTLSENHVFSPTTLNSFKLSFSRTNYWNRLVLPRTYLNPDFDLSDPVGCGTACIWSFVPGLPTGGFNPGSGVTAMTPPGTFPNYHHQNVWTIAEDVYHTVGKHAFKFGTLLNRFNDPNLQSKAIFGTINFNNIYASSGANFLGGTAANFNLVAPGANVVAAPGSTLLAPPFHGQFLDRNVWFNTYGFYVQDDYRATSRLTLNLGLRYEFRGGFSDTGNRLSTIPDLRTSTTYLLGQVMQNPTFRNWSPRVGWAWDVFGNGKTALRGGFGIFYDVGNYGALLTQNPTGTPPFVANTTFQGPITLTNPDLPLTLQNLGGGSAGKSLQLADYQAKSPHSYQFSLTIEQQLPLQLALSASYVGRYGTDLYAPVEGNPAVPVGTDAKGDPTYNVAAGQAGCLNTTLTVGQTTTFANPLSYPCRVNPYWGSAIFFSNIAESWYHGLQVGVTRRLAGGLMLQGQYTYSKAMDDTQGVRYNDDCGGPANSAFGVHPLNITQDWAPSCYDITHVMNLSVLYHFPTIRSSNFLTKFTNGWWVGNIVSIHGGSPFTPVINTDRSFGGIITQGNLSRPSRNTTAQTVTIGGQTYNFIPYDPNTVITGNPNQWFNPLMFGEPALGTIGNGGRNVLRDPGLANWDFSLVKDTKLGFLGEAGGLQFRAEFFNILNHTNFGFLNQGTAVFAGTTAANTLAGGNIQPPLASAGQITTTNTTSRQIQLALKVIF